MKRIECTIENIPAIKDALAAVNGSARKFVVDDANFVAFLGIRAERYLEDNHVVESDRTLATASYNPAGPERSSYGYAATSTRIRLSRQAGKWYISAIEKIDVWPKEPERFAVRISDKAADNLAKRAMVAFGREMSPAMKEMIGAGDMAEREIKQLKRDVKYLRGKLEKNSGIELRDGGVREARISEETALAERDRIESKRLIQDALVAKLERGEKLTPDELAAI